MNVISQSEAVSGGYAYENLTCIVGEEIVRLLQCEITQGELPWIRNIVCNTFPYFI